MHYVASNEWSRLGQLLTQRRITLNPKWANRKEFQRARGLTDTQYVLIMKLETNARENFEDSTFALVEWAYQLRPGSLLHTLSGGPLEPIEEPDEGQGKVLSFAETVGPDNEDSFPTAPGGRIDVDVSNRDVLDAVVGLRAEFDQMRAELADVKADVAALKGGQPDRP